MNANSICIAYLARRSQRRCGSAMILIAILLPLVLAVAGYAINLAYMELVRTELQIATDVATRAAGRTLAVTGSTAEAMTMAGQVAELNPVGATVLKVSEGDFVFGVSTRKSEQERYSFQAGSNPNAVQISSSRFASENTPLLFPNVGNAVSFRPLKTAISTQSELELSLVLDRSGSMVYSADQPSDPNIWTSWSPGMPVPTNSRWIDTVSSVTLLLQHLNTSFQTERISLVTYSDTAGLDVPSTGQYSLIGDALYRHSQGFGGGATNIGGGILEGAYALNDSKKSRPWASRVIILMSDGIHNTGLDPIQVAQYAASQYITMYTISFSQEADQALMETLATICRGSHYHATTSEQLTQAFQDIASRLPMLITY